MSNTVADYAKELRKSDEALLMQLRQAGVMKNASSDRLTEADKQTLLSFLKASNGSDDNGKKKITLTKRNTLMEVDVTRRARPIQVEIRNGKTFIQKDEVNVIEAAKADEPLPSASGTTAVQSALHLPASEQQELREFAAELETALRDIGDAVKQSQKTAEKISELKDTLDSRGFWGAISANFSGSTQKDLTTQILALSKNVSVTQQVVRIMLKAQTQSDRVLRSFNDALVEKLFKLKTDTETLDESQRVAAIALLGELQKQVQEQVRQRDLVTIHEEKLQELQEERMNETVLLNGIETDLERLQERSAELGSRIDSIDQWQIDRDGHAAKLASKIAHMFADAEEMQQRFSQLEAWSSAKQAGDLEMRQQLSQLVIHCDGLQKKIERLESRLAMLDASRLQAQSLGAKIMQQGLALIAVVLAMFAMLKAQGIL